MICDGSEAVGGAIISVVNDELVPSTHRLVRRFLQEYMKRRPLVICRTSVLTDHQGYFLPPDPTQAALVLAEIRRVGQEITHQNGGSFFLVDYLCETELDLPWGDFLTVRDFTKAGTRMAVEWDTFDGYMEALKVSNKKAHKNVRHNQRYAEEAGITIKIAHEMPPVDVVLRLNEIKMERYHTPLKANDIALLVTGLSVLPPENFAWVMAYREDKMVGCEVLLIDPANGVCKPTLYGRDYDVDFVYFVMCYEDIRYAIETLRTKTIIYDTEAFEFKRRIGFGDDPRNHLVLYPSRWLENRLMWLMRFMND